MGIDLSKRQYVCVKSSNHYQAGFNRLPRRSSRFATPGAITPDFAQYPYTKRARHLLAAIKDSIFA